VGAASAEPLSPGSETTVDSVVHQSQFKANADVDRAFVRAAIGILLSVDARTLKVGDAVLCVHASPFPTRTRAPLTRSLIY
jgi:hypothetical protein